MILLFFKYRNKKIKKNNLLFFNLKKYIIYYINFIYLKKKKLYLFFIKLEIINILFNIFANIYFFFIFFKNHSPIIYLA